MTPPATMPARPWGLLAEFESTDSLVPAVRDLRERGYQRFDAHTPFPVEELPAAMGFEKSGMPAVVLAGALSGGIVGFALQWWVSVVAYPLNIGGRPLNSWPSFIPVTFELAILGGALFAVLGMLGLNGLPRPHHPLFAIPAFQRATTDGCFLSVRADDPLFDAEHTEQQLRDLGAKEVWHVAAE